jgi:hypothetical protein
MNFAVSGESARYVNGIDRESLKLFNRAVKQKRGGI